MNHTLTRMLARHAPVRRYRRKDKDMSTTTDRVERELLVAREQIRNLNQMLGEKQVELADIAKQRDALKVQAYEQAALRDRMQAAIDAVRHQGLRRLLWLVPLGEGSRYSDLMRVIDHDETQEILRDLANDLTSEEGGCQAEYLVRRAMGIDE